VFSIKTIFAIQFVLKLFLQYPFVGYNFGRSLYIFNRAYDRVHICYYNIYNYIIRACTFLAIINTNAANTVAQFSIVFDEKPETAIVRDDDNANTVYYRTAATGRIFNDNIGRAESILKSINTDHEKKIDFNRRIVV